MVKMHLDDTDFFLNFAILKFFCFFFTKLNEGIKTIQDNTRRSLRTSGWQQMIQMNLELLLFFKFFSKF